MTARTLIHPPSDFRVASFRYAGFPALGAIDESLAASFSRALRLHGAAGWSGSDTTPVMPGTDDPALYYRARPRHVQGWRGRHGRRVSRTDTKPNRDVAIKVLPPRLRKR